MLRWEKQIAFPEPLTMSPASRTAIAGDTASSTLRQTEIHWAVVAQNTFGASYFIVVALHAADSGDLVFQKIRREYKMMTASKYRESWISTMFTKVVVGTAEIQWVEQESTSLIGERG